MVHHAPPFDAVIERACQTFLSDARAAPEEWRARALKSASAAALVGPTPAAFLRWAESHRRWSQVVAECASEVCAKPGEAAVAVLVAIVDELFHERGVYPRK